MCGLRFPQPSNSNQLFTKVDQRIGTAVGTPVGFQQGAGSAPKIHLDQMCTYQIEIENSTRANTWTHITCYIYICIYIYVYIYIHIDILKFNVFQMPYPYQIIFVNLHASMLQATLANGILHDEICLQTLPRSKKNRGKPGSSETERGKETFRFHTCPHHPLIYHIYHTYI
jgi:hypothetical protein